MNFNCVLFETVFHVNSSGACRGRVFSEAEDTANSIGALHGVVFRKQSLLFNSSGALCGAICWEAGIHVNWNPVLYGTSGPF